jgi:hypothetical protein
VISWLSHLLEFLLSLLREGSSPARAETFFTAQGFAWEPGPTGFGGSAMRLAKMYFI